MSRINRIQRLGCLCCDATRRLYLQFGAETRHVIGLEPRWYSRKHEVLRTKREFYEIFPSVCKFAYAAKGL